MRGWGWSVVVVATLLALLAGCPPHDGDARDLAVWSTTEAARVVDEQLQLLDTHKGTDGLERVLKRFCDQSPTALEKTRALLHTSSTARLRVRHVEPAWVGKEPWFAVEIGDHDGDDDGSGTGFVHTLGVRVRDGCLDRAVGATPL